MLTIHATKGALNSIGIKPTPTEDGSNADHYRVAVLELSTPTGLTMEKYRMELDQNLAQTRASLSTHYFLYSPPQAIFPPKITHSLTWGVSPGRVSTMEVSEAEGEGGSANGHTLSHNDSGKNSLPRRILRRLIPSSVGRKNV